MRVYKDLTYHHFILNYVKSNNSSQILNFNIMTENDQIKLHQGLVYNIAKSFGPKDNAEMQEYIQEGNIALLNAIRKYDTNKGKLTTLAWKYITRAIWRYCKLQKKCKEKQLPVPEREYVDQTNLLLEILPNDLSKLEIIILDMKYKNYTFEEIGKKFNKTKSWASQKFYAIIEKLKVIKDNS